MRFPRQIEFCMKRFGRKKNPAFELRIQGFRRIPYIWNLLRKSLGCVTMRCFAHAKEIWIYLLDGMAGRCRNGT